MKLKNTFSQYSELIKSELDSFFETKLLELNKVNSWPDKTFSHLKSLLYSGKMLRGSLFLHTFKLLNEGEITKNSIKVAAALELSQTGILIHDDIIDRDSTRRGLCTFHYWFRDIANKNNLNDSEHIGNSQAICLGDICFFLSYELLTSVNCIVSQEFSKEFTMLGFAEMGDIFLDKSEIQISDIVNIHRYKTARYTYYLPLKLAYLLNGINSNDFEDYALNLGLIFQIKDDELGIFGESNIIGKPQGSDIIEGKKTLYYYYLPDEYKKFFGKQLSPNKFQEIKDKIVELKIQEKVEKLIIEYEIKARAGLNKIKNLDLTVYNELIDYNVSRIK